MTQSLTMMTSVLCNHPDFHQFLSDRFHEAWYACPSPSYAEKSATIIRSTCGIQSRKELDSNTHAARLYHQKIGLPFSTYRIHVLKRET